MKEFCVTCSFIDFPLEVEKNFASLEEARNFVYRNEDVLAYVIITDEQGTEYDY